MRKLPTLAFALIGACGPTGSPDGGSGDASCTLELELGTGDRHSFVPLADGDPVEVILGFQGFRMLLLAVRVAGDAGEAMDLGAHLAIVDSSVELDQRNTRLPLREASDGTRLIDGWLIFFNDVPASEVVGRDADLELVGRGTTTRCTGAARVRVRLRDDQPCVDPDAAVPDASILDGGIPDGAVVCGTP